MTISHAVTINSSAENISMVLSLIGVGRVAFMSSALDPEYDGNPVVILCDSVKLSKSNKQVKFVWTQEEFNETVFMDFLDYCDTHQLEYGMWSRDNDPHPDNINYDPITENEVKQPWISW